MRLNNRNKIALFHFLITFVIITFFTGIAAFFVERYLYNYLGWSSSLLIIIPTLLLIIFYYRGRPIFEYDSDGEALNIKNRNPFIFWSKPLSDEFPKYKLMNYEIVNAIVLKRLFLTIASKKNHSIILKYDISYLTKKEVSDLKLSLSKVIKVNKEREKI
jgi:hypothetical protein